MKDPQLKQQMADFGKRKSYGPGDPPKKKKKAAIKPAAEVSSDKNDMLASVRAKFPKKKVKRNNVGGKNNSFTVSDTDGRNSVTFERSLLKE